LDPVKSKGSIIAGVSFDIPGMGYKDPDTGRIEGFEADLARALGEKILGPAGRVDFQQVTDEKRVEALQSDRVDMVLSQLTITPDRAAEVDFSVPYLVTGEGLLVRKGGGIAGLEDLAGRHIAVTAGSVSLRRMRASLPELPGATLVITPLGLDGLKALENGTADAVSNDLVNLTMLRQASGEADRLEIIDIRARFDPKPFGVAVRKGRQSLIDLLNPAIEALKASGEIDRLLQQGVASAAAAPQ
jgi:putative glutamine transport system substrate-binding protein